MKNKQFPSGELVNDFPINELPEQAANSLIEIAASTGSFLEYAVAGAFAAVSTAMGKSIMLNTRNEFIGSSNLWAVVVGKPSTGKTPILKATLMRPFDKIERENERSIRLFNSDNPDKPPMKYWPLIATDATIEALADNHKHQPMGILQYSDEVSTWMSGFNQYRKGGDDKAKWMQLFSQSTLVVTRVTKDTTRIEMPHVSLLGGIQPGALKKLDSIEDGFLDRFMFFPKPNDPVPLEVKKQDDVLVHQWESTINRIYDETRKQANEDHIVTLKFDAIAQLRFNEWDGQIRLITNNAQENNDDASAARLGKAQHMVSRICLIVHALKWAQGQCPMGISQNVDLDTLERAIRIYEGYIYPNVCATVDMIKYQDPLDKLNNWQRTLYASLPDDFDVGTAKEQAQLNTEISTRQVERFLANQDLFKRVSRGKYQKL